MTFLFVGGKKKNEWNSLAMSSERKKTVELFKPLHWNGKKRLELVSDVIGTEKKSCQT